MAIEGIDVSHNNTNGQPYANFGGHGLGFALVKCTQGMNFKDPLHDANVAGARGHGLIPGSYHFLERNNGAAQCDEFIATAAPVAQDPHLWAVDVEVYQGHAGDTFPLPPDLEAFHNRFHNRMPGRALLVYSYASFWHYNFGGYLLNCTKCRLWTSYLHPTPPLSGERSPGDAYPEVYGGFPGVTLHQYDTTGVDKDRYYGSQASLLALATPVFSPPSPNPTPTPTPPPIPGDEEMVEIICAPGKHHPRTLSGTGQVSAELGPDTWTAYNELARLGGAKIIVMETQASYDAIVRHGGGS